LSEHLSRDVFQLGAATAVAEAAAAASRKSMLSIAKLDPTPLASMERRRASA
jgi:hypothetical protein